jgi:hypothetical protein
VCKGGVDLMYGAATVLEDLPLRIPETHRVTTPTLTSHYARAGSADFDLDVIVAHDLADFKLTAPKVREANFYICTDDLPKLKAWSHAKSALRRLQRKLSALQLEKTFLTEFHDHWVIINNLTASMTSTPELSPRETGVETALARSKNRLAYLLSLPDGWLGEGSRAPSKEAAERASELLAQINAVAPGALPDLSLEEDGTIVMSWNDGGLAGSLSIHADGRYAYFIERDGGGWASDGMASVEAGIAPKLSEILAA